MRNFGFLFVLLTVSATVSANDYFNRFSAQLITESVYVIHGPREMPNAANRGFMNNPAFIIGKESVVVIDPGSSHETGAMVLREIKKITDKPVSHIFNTHIHGDHWLGNEIIQQKYPDTQIFADPRMIKKAKAGEAQSWMDNLMSMTDGATSGTKIAYPDTEVSNGMKVKAAGLHFNIYTEGVAHSDSDILIEYVEGSTMFVGDTVGYERILRMDDGGFRDVMKALDKAISLNLKYYVPGHGNTGDISIVQLQREYFDTLSR